MNKTISNIELLTIVQMKLIDEFHSEPDFSKKNKITQQLIELNELIEKVESKKK